MNVWISVLTSANACRHKADHQALLICRQHVQLQACDELLPVICLCLYEQLNLVQVCRQPCGACTCRELLQSASTAAVLSMGLQLTICARHACKAATQSVTGPPCGVCTVHTMGTCCMPNICTVTSCMHCAVHTMQMHSMLNSCIVLICQAQ